MLVSPGCNAAYKQNLVHQFGGVENCSLLTRMQKPAFCVTQQLGCCSNAAAGLLCRRVDGGGVYCFIEIDPATNPTAG